MKNKTYYDLFLKLSNMTKEELQAQDITISINDEYYGEISIETCDDDVLDDGHLYLKLPYDNGIST